MIGAGPETIIAVIMLMALILYALLGGADYGGGVWDLLARGPRAEAQRALIAGAIGPVWEANHVWLILVVVLLFSAFPPAFARLTTALHLPLSLLLVGIVLRGSAFTFRSYEPNERARKRWSRLFSIPSLITPVLLGMTLGAVATGRIGPQADPLLGPFSQPWLGLFPLTVGLFALAIFAYVAAVYLTLETDDPALQNDFRRRALAAAVMVGALAWAVYLLARTRAPLVFQGLSASPWGFPIRVATGVFAVLALLALGRRWYPIARVAAMVQVALILWGCGLAQYPYLVPPELTVTRAAAPRATLELLLVALAVGAVLLIPSLVYLFRVFKGHTFALRARAGNPTAVSRSAQVRLPSDQNRSE
jgi:cytochrome d ubiquinol oxidase subunit II